MENVSEIREELCRIISELPEGQLKGVRQYLRVLHLMDTDPVLQTLANAPLDDEPETPDEVDAVCRAREDIEAGRTLSTDELRRQLGL